MGLISEWLTRHRRALGAAVVLGLVVLGLWRVRAILPPFILAVVLSYLLSPLVNLLVRRGVPRLPALALVYLTVVGAGVVAVVLLVPAVVGELTKLAEFLPGYFADVQRTALELQAQYSQVQIPVVVRQAIDDAIAGVQVRALGFVSSAVQSVVGVFSAFFSLALAPILSFYMVKDRDRLRRSAQHFVPAAERAAFGGLLSDVDRVLSGYIRGQLMVTGIVGLLVAVTLTVLGIRFAVILGIVAGLAEIVPYFGPLLSAIPALAVASTVSPLAMVKVAVAWVVIQQIESQLISPRVIGKHVGMHPLAVVFALLVGAELYGVIGMIVAVPIAAVLRLLVDYFWSRDSGTAPESGSVPAGEAAEAGPVPAAEAVLPARTPAVTTSDRPPTGSGRA